jgi:hypothetical protein
MKLLKLPMEMQEKVHLGKLAQKKALAHLDGKDTPSVLVQREREVCLRGVSVGKGRGESLITL